MFRVTTIHTEVLVPVRGLDMQVSPDPSIHQVDPCVEEGYLFGRPGGSKLDGRVVMVQTLNKGT